MSREFIEAGWATDAWQKPQTGKTVVMFRKVATQNAFKSEEQKRPVFDEKIHIVKIPADQFLRIDRPVRPEDKVEYAAEWAAWERSQETKPLGIGIDYAHFLTDTQKAEFKAMGVLTIEQLAELPDIQAQKIMGAKTLIQKAQVFLAAGRDAELVAKLKSEHASELASLKAQMDELKAMLEEATKPKGKS